MCHFLIEFFAKFRTDLEREHPKSEPFYDGKLCQAGYGHFTIEN
jgi:hypothetical protein